MESNNKFYGGIDPGKTGHVVILNDEGDIIDHYEAPKIGRIYDKQEMAFKLHELGIEGHICLEDVHTVQMGGKSSNFDLGHGKGLWEMALMCIQIPHSMVAPKEWQKEMWLGAKKQYKPTARKKKNGDIVKKIDTKLTSLAAAKMLKPAQDWRMISPKTGNPLKGYDDGFVDAYLIAEYCRRKKK